MVVTIEVELITTLSPSEDSIKLKVGIEILTLGEGFNSKELTGHWRKVDPNKSVILDRFVFVRRYVDKDVSMEHVEESERLVGWVCMVSLMDLR